MSSLNDILIRRAPAENDKEWKRSFKAVASLFYDKEIATISASLSQSLAAINQYQGAYTAATTGTILRKLTAAVAAVPEKNVTEKNTSSTHFVVPIVWSDEFTGRKEILKKIELLMENDEQHRRIAMIGLGGVGKTRVMLQYAYRFKDTTTSVLWIHASSISRVNKACLEIAKAVKFSRWDDPKSDKLELVREWLESPESGKWLLFLDNADDFDLLFGAGRLAKFLPRSNHGAILMTTRDARVGMEFAKQKCITLGALTNDESTELLRSRLGDSEESLEHLQNLGEELCGIPLALVQASSFIKQNYLTIPDYLELYRASDLDKIELLSEDFDDEIRDSESRNPVATTWSVSFDYIRKRDPLAAEMLSIMSTLDSQAIPESLLNFGSNKIKFQKALVTLQAFALVSARSDGFSWEGRKERLFDLHRLVRLAMRSWLNHHEELESHTAKALSIMAQRFTDGDWETRGKWSSYLPHAAVLLASEHFEALDDSYNDPVSHDNESGTLNHRPEGIVCQICAASLLTILATCHYTIGKPSLSLNEAEKAYRIRRNLLGENHVDTLAVLDLIAKPAKDLYLFDRAVEVCQLAIKGKTDTLGPDHPSTLRSYAYLGITYRPMGRLHEAKKYGTHALEHRRKHLGKDHPDTLISMGYVATVTRALGDYPAAIKIETEKFDAWTKLQGPSHPVRLEAMAELAWAHACQGNYNQAAQLMSHSVNAQLELHGSKHFFTMWSMANMAVILGMQGKYAEAEELCERVLELRTKYMGVSHPFRYVSKLYLAWLYNETGRYQEAEAIEREVLVFQQGFYGGKGNHDVLLTESQLASTLTYLGNHEEANKIKSDVLEIRMKSTGARHPVTLRCKSTLGLTCMHLGEFATSESLLVDAWENQKEVLGEGHPETITTVHRIAGLRERQGRHEEAQKLCEIVVEASVRALGEMHPRTRARVADLGRFDEFLKHENVFDDKFQVEGPDPTEAVNRLLAVVGISDS
ncbi:P-loop containing nucleoside triphosphate hydrolase [Glarea lozoyensis ATCC 20868]|uniref:p-loop containing nucleoside triphosphate hydrolase n=1 Tax=Glarea lozoyensis (strain ATCC 20868 / MF5171) TaxID=1116229 RepID=S3CLW1_GLAL2|nr:P-loop containing nucleoside triphosphate hydrolase [Glarea lozoyensis ATCC 20868]EPE27492.1 P-loop containing nucleoside triphosphate hydrolase [Glarea lozoyensis ATCC 20868]